MIINLKNKTAAAHLIAHSKFEDIESRIIKDDEDSEDDDYGFKMMSDFDPEKDVNIRENKK